MTNFLYTLAGLKTRVTDAAAPKVLGAPIDELLVRAPALRRGANQQAAGRSARQDGEIPEVNWLFWGNPNPGGGVTIFTSDKGWALLRDDAQTVRWQTAHRIARWVTAQSRWGEAKSTRSINSVANEILCHAHDVVNDRDLSIEYEVDTVQMFVCTALGFDLSEDPSSGVPVPPDEGIV
jgi:hypothetical protein